MVRPRRASESMAERQDETFEVDGTGKGRRGGIYGRRAVGRLPPHRADPFSRITVCKMWDRLPASQPAMKPIPAFFPVAKVAMTFDDTWPHPRKSWGVSLWEALAAMTGWMPIPRSHSKSRERRSATLGPTAETRGEFRYAPPLLLRQTVPVSRVFGPHNPNNRQSFPKLFNRHDRNCRNIQ